MNFCRHFWTLVLTPIARTRNRERDQGDCVHLAIARTRNGSLVPVEDEAESSPLGSRVVFVRRQAVLVAGGGE